MRRPCLVVLVRAAAWTCAALALGVAAAAPPVSAQDTVLMLEGEVPSEGDYFLVPFEVPAGIAELEIAHDDLSDFVMISDHNTTAQLDYYAQIQAAHPSLLFIPGVEVTTYQGHAMSLGGTQWIDHRLGFEGRTIVQVAEEVRAQSALFTVNHPALSVGDACIGCAWGSELDGSLIDALEVQTGAYSVTGSIFFGRVITRWENYLAEGHHVVALGGSDDHRAGTGTGTFDSPIGSPTTMVYAAELSVDAILEGARAGRAVVRLEGASDPMVELSSADLVEGDTIVADSALLSVRVTGASEGASLALIRDGVRGAEHEVMSDVFDYEETVIAGAGLSFVRAELSIAGRPRVVTSHIFLRALTPGGPDAGLAPDAGESPVPPASSGCACRTSAARGAPAPWLAWFALALVIARRRLTRD